MASSAPLSVLTLASRLLERRLGRHRVFHRAAENFQHGDRRLGHVNRDRHDEPAVLVRNLAGNKTHSASARKNVSFRGQKGIPHRTKEVDFQFKRCEALVRSKGARECHSHCGISQITQDSSVQGAHRVCVLRSRL